ncbi:MAG: LD-carboxypeptidase, partial [Deltaproteobacteria bacterium]|nr:LD-carboxypeptidase [Deltaproteobacteria bacterium]
PIISGLEIGHGKRNLAIPIGLNATVNTEQKLLIFIEPATTG